MSTEEIAKKVSAMTTAQLRERLDALEDVTHVVATNDGTFSEGEAGRKLGTADPAFAVWRTIYFANGSKPHTENPRACKVGVGYPRVFQEAKLAAKLARYEYVAIKRELDRRESAERFGKVVSR